MTDLQNVQVVVMAGGKGTRMGSDLPKVLHKLGGEAIINRILSQVTKLVSKPIVIVGHKAEDVVSQVEYPVYFVYQKEQLGTGHAVMMASEELIESAARQVLVVPGDHPMMDFACIKHIFDTHNQSNACMTILSFTPPHFEGDYQPFDNYGRILRDDLGTIQGIVEVKDASTETRAKREVNVGAYCFDKQWLLKNLSQLHADNAAHEYYITDLLGIACRQGDTIATAPLRDFRAGLGVNTQQQLAIAEQLLIS